MMAFKESLFLTEKKTGDGGIVLFSSSTGAVIQLDTEGATYWREGNYGQLDQELLRNWRFIVAKDHDELAEQRGIRQIISTMKPTRKVSYVIAPTMECNARCPYCFEENTCTERAGQMTQEVAKAVADYIANEVTDRGCEEIELTWFGGEPLMATRAIDDISAKLKSLPNIKLTACLVTNGSLLDMFQHRFGDWGIQKIQITFDGSGDDYNRLKNYKNPERHNYDKVVANVKKVAEQYPDMTIIIRVNFDATIPSSSIERLLDDVGDISENMMIYSRPVVGGETFGPWSELVDYPSKETSAETMYWFDELLANRKHRSAKPRQAITPRGSHCPYYTAIPFAIDPSGYFYQCEHYLGSIEHAVGHISNFSGWTEANATVDLPEKCYSCKILPTCQGGCEVAGDEGRCSFEQYEVEKFINELIRR